MTDGNTLTYCSICGGDLPLPEFEGDNPPEINGKPVCYRCWVIESTNKTQIIINYRLSSYIQNQEDIMGHSIISLDQLPPFIDELIRKPGYWMEFILIEKGG